MHEAPRVRVVATMLLRRPRQGSVAAAVISLLTALVVSLLAWSGGGALMSSLAASQRTVYDQGQYWRLLTAIAVHADLVHLTSNALFLALFAYLLYGYFGFWVYPVLGLAGAALTNHLSLMTYAYQVNLVGASGLVYWMAGFWLTAYLLVERSLSPGKRLMRSVAVALVVFLPTSFQETVSYRAHAIGFALGVLSAFGYCKKNWEAIRAAEVVVLEEDEQDGGGPAEEEVVEEVEEKKSLDDRPLEQ